MSLDVEHPYGGVDWRAPSRAAHPARDA
ncbi:MAG: hypothetical protein JWQ77_137, partial [Jatrophihabitans sp.]|nr:hypothetical protein [Jatrophihabitans sp.]